MSMSQWIYTFAEGNRHMRQQLGGKGANLAEMQRLGVPVPPGFTITTAACQKYHQEQAGLSQALRTEIRSYLQKLEAHTGKTFGGRTNPLLVSVRSGAAISMPGMMDTILNLGLNPTSVQALAAATNNPRFAYDSYRRFIQMFGDVVKHIPLARFEQILQHARTKAQVTTDTELDSHALQAVIADYLALYSESVHAPFPTDPYEQLFTAVEAIFQSWFNERATYYRKINQITDLNGTAVNVQMMVFGNKGPTSGTGVLFTRDPATGNNHLFGEFLQNGQGEDVVAGVRTPEPLHKLQTLMPDLYTELTATAKAMEQHYRDMQDMEFTIEEGQLYFLQTRNGKRTAQAAIKIANDLYTEGILSAKESLQLVSCDQLEQRLHLTFAKSALAAVTPDATGLAASPGAATGKIYFTASAAMAANAKGEAAILVRQETSAEDLAGMVAANGILTARGGMTSHAAVVARGMGKCCVAGCTQLTVDETNKTLINKGMTYHEGDAISLDGATGNVYFTALPLSRAQFDQDYAAFMRRVDTAQTLQVRANADTARDVLQALAFDATGIGLVRTEHMFFKAERIPIMRQMILSQNPAERKQALNALETMQREDFIAIYRAAKAHPVTIRLLDPPLHEFLPRTAADYQQLADLMHLPASEIRQRSDAMREVNPMLGHRGVRLAISDPEITRMQVRAIISAAQHVAKQLELTIRPEIMVPLVGDVHEFTAIKAIITDTIKAFPAAPSDVQIGTMIEIPRATLLAKEIATVADFFSFGTNDLTQMTFGFSRDDVAPILTDYLDQHILPTDPFKTIDQAGVGQLIAYAVKQARQVDPHFKIGVCGEHGGDPASIRFFQSLGIDYVSCSPYRVPVARLANAQIE